MTRPRRITAKYCIRCNANTELTEDQARHRMEHRRADRRRAQYRAAKARKRARELPEVAGYLHDLGCPGGHYSKRGRCVPIPVYRRLEAVA